MNESIRRNPARTGRLAAAVALLLAASAQGADFKFDIPAGDLKAALDAYVKQTGQQIVYKSDDVKGKTTPGVHGSLPDQQALDALLKGTGLQLRRDDSGAVVVFPAEAVAGGASTQTAGNDQELEEVVVTATAISQLLTTSRTITRLDADPMLLPMTVSAVQEDLLRYQQASTVIEALNNVAGMSVSAGGLVSTRGFDASVARNGTAAPGSASAAAQARPVIATERIEVAKGPEQILQGKAARAGGTVNLITKVPTPDDYALLGTSLGSNGYYRLDADVNGTLLEGGYGRLMGQVVGSTSDQGKGPKGINMPSDDYVQAGLRWTNEGSGTDLSSVYEYSSRSTGARLWAMTDSGRLRNGDKQYLLGNPNAKSDVDSDTVEVRLQQRITGSWGVELDYVWRDVNGSEEADYPYFDPETPDLLYASIEASPDFGARISTYRASLYGQFNTGPVEHKVMAAYDAQSTRETNYGPESRGTWVNNMVTGERFFVPNDPVYVYGDDVGTTDETGILLTDQIAWNQWHALLGVRWVTSDTRDVYTEEDYRDVYKEKADATLPQYGLVYSVDPNLSLYASSTEGFESNGTLRDATGKLLPNRTYEQYEVGAKAILLNGQLALTTSAYQLKQQNTPEFLDFTENGEMVFRAIPGIKSKGIEVELSGQPVRGLQLRTTYNYQDVKDEATGEPPRYGFPPSTFSLWSQYWFTRDPGHGWWAGGGLAAFDSPSVPPGRPKSTGSTLLDLSAGYQGDRWQAIAGIKNVGDVGAFYPFAGGTFRGSPWLFAFEQPGRQYRFDVTYRFGGSTDR